MIGLALRTLPTVFGVEPPTAVRIARRREIAALKSQHAEETGRYTT